MHRVLFVLFLLYSIVWLLHFRIAIAQNVPPIACPNYFEYVKTGEGFFGKITLPNLPAGTVILDTEFSQRIPVRTEYIGRLSLFQSAPTTIYNLENGIPVSYRVEFPTKNVLPKLTRLAVNDDVLCTASEYPRPSTKLQLQHKLADSPETMYNMKTKENATPQTRLTDLRITYEDCGRENEYAGTTPFVHGGYELKRGQWPWLTVIYRKKSTGLTFICGGSLVSARTVVTAAHCFSELRLTAERVLVSLGRYNLTDYTEPGYVLKDIETLVLHPDYKKIALPDADIALMQLYTPVEFTHFIRPICLWSGPTDETLIIGEKGYVGGWGADENGLSVTPVPKAVDASIVSEGQCLRSLAGSQNVTSERTLCAGNRDSTGPCMGDSGGALMLKRDGVWVLRGIVSIGQTLKFQCNLLEFVVYCDLAKHDTWLRRNILT